MKAVYVAHPLRGDVENNIRKTTEICRRIAATKKVIVFSPLHAFPSFMDVNEHDYAMQCCLRLLAAADEVWFFGDWWHSEGCMREFQEVIFTKKAYRFFMDEEAVDLWMRHMED